MSTVTKDQVIEWLSGQSVIELAALVKADTAKWGRIIRDRKIKGE